MQSETLYIISYRRTARRRRAVTLGARRTKREMIIHDNTASFRLTSLFHFQHLKMLVLPVAGGAMTFSVLRHRVTSSSTAATAILRMRCSLRSSGGGDGRRGSTCSRSRSSVPLTLRIQRNTPARMKTVGDKFNERKSYEIAERRRAVREVSPAAAASSVYSYRLYSDNTVRFTCVGGADAQHW